MLHVRGIRKRYGGIVAVDNVSFTVEAGEIVGLIGPNGAGKTTCFNLLTGFALPDTGQVLFDSQVITGLTPPQIAARGLIRTFQRTNVLPRLSVFENVLAAHYRQARSSLRDTFFPGRAVREAERQVRRNAVRLVELVGLDDRMNTVAGSLACGELRLLEIAAALGARPRLLMLDEPAAGLNSAEAERLGALLRGLLGTEIAALLLVEHNMALVMEVSDRVVVMNFGRKLSEGRPAEVRADPAVVVAYLGAEPVAT